MVRTLVSLLPHGVDDRLGLLQVTGSLEARGEWAPGIFGVCLGGCMCVVCEVYGGLWECVWFMVCKVHLCVPVCGVCGVRCVCGLWGMGSVVCGVCGGL